MDDGCGLSSDPSDLADLIDEIERKISTLEGQVAEEIAKMENYRVIYLEGAEIV